MARILLIEDDRTFSDLVTETLAEGGHVVTSIANGADALGWLQREQSPDLILLDWRLPGLSGAEVARHYRSTPAPRAPIVVLTAAADVVAAAIEAGAQGFLRKPFDLQELEDIVARMVTTHEPPAALEVPTEASSAGLKVKPENARWEAERHRLLARMLQEVTHLQQVLRRLQDSSSELHELENQRPLTPEERRHGTNLGIECTAVRLQLEVLRKEFNDIVTQRGPA
jgi:two-component system, chemotaxis family, chemotaxis protein CheY